MPVIIESGLFWPSGEVETRLSAKQALHRFDSDLGLKKYTSYFLR